MAATTTATPSRMPSIRRRPARGGAGAAGIEGSIVSWSMTCVLWHHLKQAALRRCAHRGNRICCNDSGHLRESTIVTSRLEDARRRIIIPLDCPDAATALALVEKLSGRAGMFKVGLELFCAEGPMLVRRIVERGEQVFLDLKLHDIPNTVARSTAACAGLGVTLLNIHLAGGEKMARAAVARAREAARPPKLLGVTVLTSLDGSDLAAVGVQRALADQVVELARMGRSAGLDGVVASPHEIGAIKAACGREFLVVTPGIRPAGSAAGDQKTPHDSGRGDRRRRRLHRDRPADHRSCRSGRGPGVDRAGGGLVSDYRCDHCSKHHSASGLLWRCPCGGPLSILSRGRFDPRALGRGRRPSGATARRSAWGAPSSR